MYLTHPFDPIYDRTSRILILGTMPSPKSRENQFYYTHPQNRFWRVISELLGEPIPQTNQERTAFLLKNHIALWDVLRSLRYPSVQRTAVSARQRSTIFLRFLSHSSIAQVFTTGKKSYDLYNKYCEVQTGIPAIYLPSTSPANQGRIPLRTTAGRMEDHKKIPVIRAGEFFCVFYTCQPLQTSTQPAQREYCSSSGIVNSIALLLLPQAGNTV